MNFNLVASVFIILQAFMLAGQITTLVSTYWTSWDLRFNWTNGLHFSRPEADGQLVSEGHAGLWSRCVRVYDTTREDPSALAYNCLNNYSITNGTLKFTFGKACKTATAALCVGDGAVIVSIITIALVPVFKKKKANTLIKVMLPMLLFQGLICFSIPLIYLSGNMAELIDHLSGAYQHLLVVRMTPWYIHDWAFWTQVGLLGIWGLSVGVYVILYSIKDIYNCSKSSNNYKETGDSSEMEALRH